MITGIPVVSLDALYWQPGWIEPDAAEFEARATEAARPPRWIMDGNYRSSGAGDLRRGLADTVIWFDLPRRTCMMGIMTRIATSYGRVRPEMAAGCSEQIDFEFFRYVWTYPEQQRPRLLRYLEGLRPDQALICFVTRKQADQYLTQVAPAARAGAH
ncbi:MAG TPA: DNA topology modulation protein [Bradyrhizobium sp.]|nr:DNA topology modulation protein [Bradyrhizobium sp.]